MINVLIGQTRSGKSYLIKKKIARIPSKLIIFDLQREYSARNSRTVESYPEFVASFSGGHNLILRFGDFDDYYETLEYLRQARVRNYILVIDELGCFATSNTIHKDLRRITLSHRHLQTVIFFATQSPLYCPSIIMTQATHIFVFTLERNDVENLRKKLYVEERAAEAIPKLRRGKFVTLK